MNAINTDPSTGSTNLQLMRQFKEADPQEFEGFVKDFQNQDLDDPDAQEKIEDHVDDAVESGKISKDVGDSLKNYANNATTQFKQFAHGEISKEKADANLSKLSGSEATKQQSLGAALNDGNAGSSAAMGDFYDNAGDAEKARQSGDADAISKATQNADTALKRAKSEGTLNDQQIDMIEKNFSGIGKDMLNAQANGTKADFSDIDGQKFDYSS